MMSQSKENQNGCEEQTEEERNVMESIMNEFSEYICDHLCKYPEQIKDQEELEEHCAEHCEHGRFHCAVLNVDYCRSGNAMSKFLVPGDGCSCGRRKE